MTSLIALFKEFTVTKGSVGRILGQPNPLVGHALGDTYLINAGSALQAIDTNTLEWRTLNAPHQVSSFQVSRDGTLVTVNKLQGAFSKISVSSDGGMTWKPYARPPHTIYDAVLETPESGEATRWNAGTFSASLEIYSYDPKINDWRKTGEAPAGCRQMLRDAAYRQRFCLTSGNGILSQRNGAWVVEFANE